MCVYSSIWHIWFAVFSWSKKSHLRRGLGLTVSYSPSPRGLNWHGPFHLYLYRFILLSSIRVRNSGQLWSVKLIQSDSLKVMFVYLSGKLSYQLGYLTLQWQQNEVVTISMTFRWGSEARRAHPLHGGGAAQQPAPHCNVVLSSNAGQTERP